MPMQSALQQISNGPWSMQKSSSVFIS